MISFESDYNNGVEPAILRRLIETNEDKTSGYGFDPYCEQAKAKIKSACELSEADIFFLVGGTQTNSTVIDSLLCNYEGVICVDTGHINVHEAGAIEAFSHKVIALPSADGKLKADQLENYMATFTADESSHHMVQPGMVYITFPTELGGLYTKQELAEIYDIDLSKSYSYGDTNGDMTMFRHTGHPCAINPSRELLTGIYSDKELYSRIKVVVERKDVIYHVDLDTLEFE